MTELKTRAQTVRTDEVNQESDGEPDGVSRPNRLEETQDTEALLWSPDGIRKAQLADPDIGKIVKLLEDSREKPSWDVIAPMSSEVKKIWFFWPRLEIKDGVLMRKFESPDGTRVHDQVVLPRRLREQFLTLVHGGTTGGHLGLKKTSATVQSRTYWPTWSSDVQRFMKQCQVCARYHRGSLPRRGELQTPQAGEPWERVSIDITGPHPKSSRQNQYILTVIDHFSKWAEAIAIPNHTAIVVAKALLVHVFSRYGTPVQLLSDQGREFQSELFAQLMKWLEIEKLRTTAYKPSTNGMVERFHRTLNTMLGKVVSESQRDWDECLPFVMAAYRASPHSSTGYSPNRLFLGRENRMPVDVAMGLPREEVNGGQHVDDYVAVHQERAESAYRLVREHLKENAQRRKVAYDVRVKKSEFSIGDWVWYFYPRRYPRKSPKWQRSYIGPFLIVRAIPPVNYVLQRTSRSQTFVVHVDKLKRCHGPTPESWLNQEGGREMKSPTSEHPNPSETPTSDDRRPALTRDGLIVAPRSMRDRPRRSHVNVDGRVNTSSTTTPRLHRPPAYLRDYV